ILLHLVSPAVPPFGSRACEKLQPFLISQKLHNTTSRFFRLLAVPFDLRLYHAVYAVAFHLRVSSCRQQAHLRVLPRVAPQPPEYPPPACFALSSKSPG